MQCNATQYLNSSDSSKISLQQLHREDFCFSPLTQIGTFLLYESLRGVLDVQFDHSFCFQILDKGLQ